jgi:high-affinity iron transporter
VALAVLVLFINRVGYKLPMKTLFKASTVLLVVTAVILLGKGLRALQEVGMVPLSPIPLFTFEPLGIFPDALTFFPQLVLAAIPIVMLVIKRRGSSTRLADAS